MMNTPDFSVIIPQRNSLNTIPKLLDSIPNRNNIEIILVDNSPTPISKSDICSSRDYVLLWSPPDKFAGGARNRGVEYSHGKWLIFADADDYFVEGAFDVFNKHLNDKYDIIYFSSKGVYSDGSGLTDRAMPYNNLINHYLRNPAKEINLRLGFSVPWAKMLKSQFVKEKGIKFDEVTAANDAYFSLLTGYYAESVMATKEVVYIVTTSRGSLTKRKDNAAIWSRYVVKLRKNKFLREHGLSDKQSSIMYFISESRHYGIKCMLKFLAEAVKYRQNIFIGFTRWMSTCKKKTEKEKKESKYYTYKEF